MTTPDQRVIDVLTWVREKRRAVLDDKTMANSRGNKHSVRLAHVVTTDTV